VGWGREKLRRWNKKDVEGELSERTKKERQIRRTNDMITRT
jgi:hypothetical protein